MSYEIHPSERTTVAVCDSDEYCVTPGRRRKVNVCYDRDGMGFLVPVLYICKGCARHASKASRARKLKALAQHN